VLEGLRQECIRVMASWQLADAIIGIIVIPFERGTVQFCTVYVLLKQKYQDWYNCWLLCLPIVRVLMDKGKTQCRYSSRGMYRHESHAVASWLLGSLALSTHNAGQMQVQVLIGGHLMHGGAKT